MKEVAKSIREENFKEYQQVRYNKLGVEDGEPITFHGEDFSGVNFGQFSAGFFEFYDCNLDNVSELYGQPITIEGGTARQIDMRGIRAIVLASGVDFSGMMYDDETELAYGDDGKDARSEFIGCQLDPGTVDFLKSQGAVVKD